MNKKEFINWLETKTSYKKEEVLYDTNRWKEWVDFEHNSFDVITFDNETVLYHYIDNGIMGLEEYTFEEFVNTYEKYHLKI